MIWSKDEQQIIYVANDAELLNRNYYLRLWVFCRSLPFSRREILEELTNTFRDADVLYRYLWRSGNPYELPEIEDDVFPDPDMRWYSEFLQSDPTGARPKIRSRMLERLRILDLYARVKHPLVSRHFGR
tara:strand:- start:490 stop:876 length:387 start_codon:yes stop_codon:yes gene_type:complete